MSIFGKLFGITKHSKATKSTNARAGHFDGTHIIPSELWGDPKLGSFLREVGVKPDDPNNLIQTYQKEYEDRIKRSQSEMNARLSAFNENIKREKGGACRAVAFFLFGDDCWNGKAGQFLLQDLELSPYDEWNVVYLAADEETAKRCEIPLHPGRIAEMEAWTCRLIGEIEQQLIDASGRRSRFEGNLDEIKAYQNGKPRARSDVFAVANHIRNSLTGNPAPPTEMP